MMNPLVLKFLKFSAVGASGVLVNFGVTWFFKEICKLNKYLSNILGFIFAATTNYLLNRWWTFQSTNPEVGTEYAKYFLISIVGLGIDTLTVGSGNTITLAFWRIRSKTTLCAALTIIVSTSTKNSFATALIATRG